MVCDKVLCVSVCEVIVCEVWYVRDWYVRKLEVEAGGRREAEEPGIQNQKQEPHTKLWGKM